MSRCVKRFIRNVSLLLVVLITAAALFAAPGANLAGAAVSPAESAIEFLQNEYTTKGLVNHDEGVGSYALYVLIQADVDVSAWEYEGTRLDEAVVGAINDDISDPAGLSAKLLAQDLAAAVALGEDGLADQLVQVLQDRESSAGFDGSPYSDIPAYDLLGRTGKLSVVNAVYARECILAAQDTTAAGPDYGSFGGTWEEVYYPDFMATAQAVRALHYLDPGESDVEIQAAVDAALNWMEDMQQDDGSFSGSAWDDPVVDTSEVIVTLKTLGLAPDIWESGSGNTAVDYMMNEARNGDGSFGASGNAMDATWALCAYNLTDTQFYLSPPGTTLNVGGTKQFEAVWQGADETVNVTGAAQWSVADETIASVSGSGLVTALKAGATEVSAAYGGLTASVGVTVKSSSPGGPGGNRRTVYLAVVGKDSEVLCSPKKVSVSESNEWGLTALGALDASGLSYQTSSWSYGVLVYSIEGQANSGMSGWMFTVNDVAPTVGSDKYDIDADDKIIFYYSRSMDQEPPQWSDLEKQTSTSGGPSGGLPAPLSDSDFNAAVKNAAAAGQVNLKSAQNETSLALTAGQVSKVLDTGKPLAVTIQGAQFMLSPESLEAPELADGDAAFIKFEAKKLSGEEVGALPSPSSDRLKIAGEIYELTIRVLNEDGTPRDIDQFPGCTVLLPVPAGMEDAAAAGMLKAYWYNEDSGLWEEAGGSYDAENGVVGFNVDHFSKYALMETVAQPVEEVVFIDTAGHWARAEIEYMAAKGYVAGVGENQFAPENKITRAEFAAILARMAGLADNNGAADRFSDVPAGAWYRGLVGAATTAGLVYGTSENSFAPDEPVTREQMAAMMVRLMAKKGVGMTAGEAGLLAGFGDSAEISPWASTPVALAVKDGLMVGRESGQFVPLGSATRAEAAVVLYRVLQKLPQLEK